MDRSSNPITQTITQRTSQVAKNRVLDILDSQKISSEDIVIPEKISRLFFDPQFSNITPFLKYIIQQGTVNAIREDSTALEVALYHGYLPVVDFLLLFPEILINR